MESKETKNNKVTQDSEIFDLIFCSHGDRISIN